MDTRDNAPMEHKNREEEQRKDVASNSDDFGINETVSGDDRTQENRDSRRHHQDHGNRKYQSYKNHSSADDQPMTDTGA